MTRVSAWMYLFYGTEIIQSKFDQAKNGSFDVLAPDKRYVFVSSDMHLRELDKAPDTVLSLQAASKQMLQPQYTMHRFNWFDRRGTEGVGFIRALRTLLTNNIPQILPSLSMLINTSLTDLLAEHPIVDGSRHSPVYHVIQKLVVLSNAVSFFGEDSAQNEEFMVSALQYIEETILCAEILKLMPRALTPVIGAIIQRCLSSHKAIYEVLLPIADRRCLERDLGKLGGELPKHADCIQWIMETSPRKAPWTGKRVVHELMAIWFGSVHALTTTITFAIHDLCLHPEYTEPLRAELEAEYSDFLKTGQGLPLLDSFIKESARLTPVESMSTRRQALVPFQFSDGTKLAAGDWACTPVRAIMQNEALYPAPLEFHGFRFVDKTNVSIKAANVEDHFQISQEKPSALCSADATWHVWGSGRMICPGRYYAAAVMKVVLTQIIRDYDCSLVDPGARRWFTWRSTTLPRPSTKVVFRPRENEPRPGSAV
ncbi:cytochrome P450 [Aspergillus keveii]|uniref:Cytochrome P450 n=1 Tax=Aspergillus keveii TaxID=714993 RepID=A0ABR4FTW7_9EURO